MYSDKEILLAAQIAYYNFDPNVIAKLTEQNQGVPPTIQQLLQSDYLDINETGNTIYYNLQETLNKEIKKNGSDSLEYERAQAAIKRYEDILSGELASGWRLADYRNENNTTGMAGCLLDTGNGSAIVGFRGSESEDSAQILFDWIISDLGLLNAYETVQHKAAENYMDYINKRFGGKYNNFATSGHSLGGNLSFHATITAPPRLRNKITQSYSLDGPGYSNEYSLLHAKEIASLAPGVLQHRGWSAVGALLFPLRNTKYVQVQVPDELSGAGLQKHDTCFPMFDGDNFMLTDKQDILAIGLSAFSKSMDLGSGFFLPPICVIQKILEQQFEEQAKAKADQKLEEYLKEHEFENEQAIADFLKEKTGKEKPEYLVRGALLRCRCGTHARRMNLLKCHGVYVVSHPLVHELNCIVDDTDNNIASFGVCESPAPPPSESVSYTKDVIRDASGMEVSPAPGGFVTGHKCDPIIVNARWMDTHPPTRIVDNGHINSADRAIANSDGDEQPKGEASITTLSFLVCQYGGLIEPYNSGQEYEATENDIAKEEDGSKDEADSEDACTACNGNTEPHGHLGTEGTTSAGENIPHTDKDSKNILEEKDPGVTTYYDDKGTTFTLEWNISNVLFTNTNDLTLEQITEICDRHNPGLTSRGFDIAIYNACQERGINPKIVLATLQWEQGWCKSGRYDKAFGVGPAGQPKSYSASDFGGLGSSIDTYMKWYNEGLNLNLPYQMVVNRDANLQDAGASGTSKNYVISHPESKEYFANGQVIQVTNAALYARLKYNQWLYYPPDKVHTTQVWHDSVMQFAVGE